MLGNRAKAVNQFFPESQQFFFLFNSVEFFVKAQAFDGIGDIIAGYQDFQVGFNLTFFHIFFPYLPGKYIAELGFLKFCDGFVKNSLVHLKTNFRNKAALFSAKNISCSTDIEVTHGNVQPRSYI